MRFNNADNGIHAFAAFFVRGLQHMIGFADTGTAAEKYLQLTALLFDGIDSLQQGIGIGAFGGVIHEAIFS